MVNGYHPLTEHRILHKLYTRNYSGTIGTAVIISINPPGSLLFRPLREGGLLERGRAHLRGGGYSYIVKIIYLPERFV